MGDERQMEFVRFYHKTSDMGEIKQVLATIDAATLPDDLLQTMVKDACRLNDLDMIKLLVGQGMNADHQLQVEDLIKDEEKVTNPASLAVENMADDDVRILEFLLESGVDTTKGCVFYMYGVGFMDEHKTLLACAEYAMNKAAITLIKQHNAKKSS